MSQTDRRHIVPKARPIVRSAKNYGRREEMKERGEGVPPLLILQFVTTARRTGTTDVPAVVGSARYLRGTHGPCRALVRDRTLVSDT